MAKLLIVEDETPIAELIELVLSGEGHACTLANDGEVAADLLAEHDYDLVLLDIMLPEVDGYELFRYAEQLDMPALFVTARADLADRVKGLRMGGVDYITKPFEPEELAARVENALRRNGQKDGKLAAGNLILDPAGRTVSCGGAPVLLSPIEFDLLALFLRHPGEILRREYVYSRVWGGEMPAETRTLDTHVQRLRGKLGGQAAIVTVYGTGYRLEVSAV